MNLSNWIRKAHRGLSITFTLFVVANIILNIVSAPEQLGFWVGILTLIPLALLMLSGLYLFVLPYRKR